MIKRKFNIKLILILIVISSNMLLLSSYKQLAHNIDKNNSFNNSDALISPANLSNAVKNLIKIGGTDNFYIFEVKNSKEIYKKVSCWIDLFEDEKLKTSFGKLTSELQGSDKVKYISIALNNSSIDTNKREVILSIITNTGVSQERTVDEVNLKLGEASTASQEQKLIKGQDTDLAVFIQNTGRISVPNAITENMKELLKNKRVYIFKCRLENQNN